MFFRHSHVFVHKYISNETRLQLSTIKAESIEIPSIVICPVRQFRSIVFDNSTPDFMYAVTHFYELSNEVPHIHGINLSLSDAVETALEKVHQIANLSSWSEQINWSKEFYEEFSVIFPHVASLMNIHNVLLIVSQPRQRLENFTNFTFWNNQNHECLQKYLSFNNSEQNPNIYEDPRNISLFIGCRINKAIQLLTEFRFEMAQFPQYALTAQKPMNETILWCRWLDGGNCVYKEL
ncbi:hypothetical protein Ddc_16570 [Ditylenchus destructor]|nr:hypothetical protein Ddc_16570 [Ditylenchus destructor]